MPSTGSGDQQPPKAQDKAAWSAAGLGRSIRGWLAPPPVSEPQVSSTDLPAELEASLRDGKAKALESFPPHAQQNGSGIGSDNQAAGSGSTAGGSRSAFSNHNISHSSPPSAPADYGPAHSQLEAAAVAESAAAKASAVQDATSRAPPVSDALPSSARLAIGSQAASAAAAASTAAENEPAGAPGHAGADQDAADRSLAASSRAGGSMDAAMLGMPRQLAVVYGATSAWPLAHMPNPAAHGSASTALGDSLKAHEHAAERARRQANGEQIQPLKLLVCGGLAGALSRTATAPMDRLRMLQQVHHGSSLLSMRQGWANMLGEGTLRAFFRGNGTGVLKNIPEMGLKLGAAEYGRARLSADGAKPTLGQRLLIGGLAGAVAQATIYPLEVVQTRLAVSPPGTYAGIWDTLTKTLAHEGPRGLFRGMTPTMCGILPYAGIDIAVFGLLRERMTDPPEENFAVSTIGCAADEGNPGASSAQQPHANKPAALYLLAAGMISSTSAQLCSFPLGLVRTRLQAQGMGGKPVLYAGMIDAFQKIVRQEGLRGLYKGLLPDMAKIAPASAISWTVFERTKSWQP